MAGNLHNKVIGKCSQCGGPVSIPTVWHSVDRPVPQCEWCGAVASETEGLPVIPTKPVRHDKRFYSAEQVLRHYKVREEERSIEPLWDYAGKEHLVLYPRPCRYAVPNTVLG